MPRGPCMWIATDRQRSRGLDLVRAEPVASNGLWLPASSRSILAKASTVSEEHVKDTWYLMWHAPGSGGPQLNGSFE